MWSRGQLIIGATARALLTQPGFVGRVLAVVTSAVYLGAEPETRFLGENGFLWLAQNHLPMHPRALRGDFDFDALRVGMPFRSDGARLQFERVGATGPSPLQFADARLWQPVAIDPARIAPREAVMVCAREFDPTGFGKSVRSFKDARALIGLGEGLTPSGDDFVGGWLFAAYHLRAVYPGAVRWDQRAVGDLLEYARTRTNTISFALLRDHARGESVEPLHDWLAALLRGASPREIEMYAGRVGAIGSTTGENLLAGAATTVLSLADDGRK